MVILLSQDASAPKSTALNYTANVLPEEKYVMEIVFAIAVEMWLATNKKL